MENLRSEIRRSVQGMLPKLNPALVIFYHLALILSLILFGLLLYMVL